MLYSNVNDLNIAIRKCEKQLHSIFAEYDIIVVK